MSKKKEVYCKLECPCFYGIEELKGLKKERSKDLPESDEYAYAYVENLDDFQSVKSRIIEINKFWRNKHPETERYASEEKKEAFRSGKIFDEDYKDIYIFVFINNRWGDSMMVGLTYLGWLIPGCSSFTSEYLKNKLAHAKSFEESRTFVFSIPDWTEFLERKFISEESACSLIEEWLDTGEFTKYYINKSGEIKIYNSDIDESDRYFPIRSKAEETQLYYRVDNPNVAISAEDLHFYF